MDFVFGTLETLTQLSWRRRLGILGAASIALLTVGSGGPAAAGTISYDLAILNGRVMDPESGLDAVRNVAVQSGKIVAISSDKLTARRVIDAKGLVVTPGFIDMHEHGQEPKNYEFQARDGVTTSLELEIGTDDVAGWYGKREGKALINYGVSIGHVPVRMQVLKDPGGMLPTGDAAHRAATPDELAQIGQRIENGLKQGALSVGMAINYTPATSHPEVLQMFRIAASRGAPLHVHMRFLGAEEPNTGLAALQEAIANAATTGAQLHVVHVTSMGLRETPQLIAMVRAAQEKGIDVTTECYPYSAASTSLQSALFDPGWQERMGISYSNIQWVKTGERLTEETFNKYRKEGGEVVIFMIPDEVVRAAIADPIVMIASDGMRFTGAKVHPRGQGSYARVLGRYVREEKALDLMTALSKMSLMPAQRLQKHAPMFKDKGRVRVGADADLAIFDAQRVIDKATFEEPMQYSEGIRFVLVNGVLVVSKGELVKGVLPGRAARAPFVQ
jgi:N-acyl-D-aspartate/D-glutamate deacylase